MWKLGLRLRSFFSGNIKIFSLQCTIHAALYPSNSAKLGGTAISVRPLVFGLFRSSIWKYTLWHILIIYSIILPCALAHICTMYGDYR